MTSPPGAAPCTSVRLLGALSAPVIRPAAAQAALQVLPGALPGDRRGWSVAGAGDIDGDGRADLLVGAYHDDSPTVEKFGSVKLYSGLTGALLHVFYEDQI